jgi:AcrR family transcriptional regulator
MNKNESKYFNTALLMDEALLLLLEKKDFAFISVKEICQKAGVNRSTFYLHYENTNELLEETIELLNEKFVSSFPKDLVLTAKNRILTSPDFLTPYLNFVKENKRVYKLIHQKPELFSTDKAFRKMYKDIFNPALDFLTLMKKRRNMSLNFT